MTTLNVHIGELARNDRGAFKIGPFGSSLKKSELVPSGIPVAGIENIWPNEFIKGFRRFVTPKKFSELSEYEIQSGDVLVTTMGTIGRAAVAPLDIGRTIIDSHLFRMRLETNRVYPQFLCYGLNSEFVVSQLKRMARGAIMEGLNTSILKECLIPLPDLSEQKRIAALLEKADRLRRTRRYARQLGDIFLQSVFLEMFGDPVTNPKNWDIEPFSEIGTLDRGRSKNRPRNAPHLYGGKYPFIQTGDIANCANYIRKHRQTYSEEGLKQSKLWPENTLCITIAANIAETGILTYPACFPDSVVGFLAYESVKIEYVQYWLSFLQRILERTAPESAQKNINLEILRDLRTPVPSLPLQQKFADTVRRFERLRAQQREAERQAEHLFQTLLHRAFSSVP